MENHQIVLVHQDTASDVASPEHVGEGGKQDESSRQRNCVDQAVVGIAGVRAHGERVLQQPGGACAGSAVNPCRVQRVPGN
jgi:hypothetical protein